MAWQEIELIAKVGGGLEQNMLDAKPLFRDCNISSLEPMDHDRMEFELDGEFDEEEFSVTKSKIPRMLSSGPTLPPTRLPSEMDTRAAPALKLLDEDYILFPSYEEPLRRDPRTERLAIINSSTSPELSPFIAQNAMDDLYLQHPPTRHVDYFTHDWTEADICASWRQVVTERQDMDAHQPRLENASWRMWAKTRSSLPTLSPEAINWIKEEDVTWLYGPLHSKSNWSSEDFSQPETLKPILKRPSLQEVILQRSVSDLSLVRLSAKTTDSSKNASRSPSPLAEMSELETPSSGKLIREKSVSFHEEVHQCIAIDTDHVLQEHSLTCVEEEYLSIKRPIHNYLRRASAPLTTFKTIEYLPPTSLKPEAIPPQPRGAFARAMSWPSRTLSYLWDQPNGSMESQSSSSADSQFQPSTEEKSIFEEDDDEDQVEWNPPRPRRFPVSQDCKVMNTTVPQEPSMTLLADEESFEIEMFGFPLTQQLPKLQTSTDEDVEMSSNRSSPSISEYMNSSTEDLDEVDRRASIFSVTGLPSDERSVSRTPSPSEDSDSSSNLNGNYQSPMTDLSPRSTTMQNERSDNYFSCVNNSSLLASVSKTRSLATTCSAELNTIYGDNNYAVQRPLAADTAMTVDDEEHWWAGI